MTNSTSETDHAAASAAETARTEQSSQARDQQYRLLAENTVVGIWQINPAGETLYINPAMLRMLELEKPEDLAGRTHHSFFTPESLVLMANEHDTRKVGTSSNYEAELLSRNGRKLPVHVCGSPVLNPDGTLQSLIGTFLDNTARKQAEESARKSEELFRAIVEDQNEFIVRWKPDGTLTFVNQAYSRFFNQSKEGLIGKSFYPFIPEEDREMIRQKVRSLTPDHPVASDTHRAILPTGQVFWQQWSDRGLFDKDGNLVELQSVGRDITARIETEEELRRSEENYRTLVEQSQDLIWAIDLQARFTFLNQAAYKTLGYRPEELLGKPFTEFVPPEHVPTYQAAFEENIRTGKDTLDYESFLVRKDGTIVALSANATVIRDSQGNPVGITGISKDISERIRAEQALKDSEKRYELAVSGSAAGLWDWNILTDEIYYAPRLRELLGYSQNEFPDRLSSVNEKLHPDDYERVWAAIREHLERRTTYNIEFRLLTKTGDYHWFLGRGQALWEESGKPYRMAGSISDITERKYTEQALRESEERFRQLANTMDEVFWMNSLLPERVLYVSPAFFRIWGVSPEALYQNPRLWLESIIPGDRQRVRDLYDNFFKNKAVPTYSAEYRIRRSDGSQRWISDTGSKIKNERGEAYRVCGIARDVTERKLAEENHAAWEAKLQQSQKMDAIGRLAGGIAHDFNNILTVISGNARMARQDLPAGHSLQEHLTEIEKSSERATDLVRQILAFSRQQEMERKPLYLAPVVEDAVKFLRSTLPASIEIRSNYESHLLPISANATQVNQVIMNLGTNASHAMNNNGLLEVRLDMVTVDANTAGTVPDLHQGRYVRLSMQDAGSGIDTSILPHIFDPFFTTKSPGQGTGLGLSVVHGIMKSHGGAVTVETEVGKGSAFNLFFPALEVEIPPSKPVEADEAQGHGERILFVDDEHSIVFITTRMLKRVGYNVTGFTNPLEALAAFKSDPDQFDLVVTDMSMPYLDGPRLIVEIKKIRPDIPIVMTTGYIRSQDVESAKGLGIAELILKPNTIHELAQTLHTILARRLKPNTPP
ncbi:PAS/PAC sensor hybrid histidine kinase [Pedosphaera parvula Ellin514]|uniref:histidine kinase n=2 Tax=Pedosphaera TaxID=1032526 RepID=B9XIC9_PEDPL|nr:PAS/PAC sensor hybrid histidine kinase [Pedosphaera parvula Ellin514]